METSTTRNMGNSLEEAHKTSKEVYAELDRLFILAKQAFTEKNEYELKYIVDVITQLIADSSRFMCKMINRSLDNK